MCRNRTCHKGLPRLHPPKVHRSPMTTADRIGDTHPVTLSVDLRIVIGIEETSLGESEGPGDGEVKRQWERGREEWGG